MIDTQFLWEKVFCTEFIDAPQCYKECNSFCCSWKCPEMDLRFMQPSGTLFYIGSEYNWMQTNEKVVLPIKSFDISGNGWKASLYYKECATPQLCGKEFERSLYCKLYPFLPVVDYQGNLQDLKLISPFDIALQVANVKSPCSVLRKKDLYLQSMRRNNEIMDVFSHPVMVFYITLANRIHDAHVDALSKNPTLQNASGKKFWTTWEIEYLSGRLWPLTEVRQQVDNDYAILCSIYGKLQDISQ